MPDVCGTCGKTFTQKRSLLRHQREAHGPGTAYGHEICGQLFKRVLNKKRHERTHANAPHHRQRGGHITVTPTTPQQISSLVQENDVLSRECPTAGQTPVEAAPLLTSLLRATPSNPRPSTQVSIPFPLTDPQPTTSSTPMATSTMDTSTLDLPMEGVGDDLVNALAEDMAFLIYFEDDPVDIPDHWLPTDDATRRLYRDYWSSIRRNFQRRQPIQDVYNYRLTGFTHLTNQVEAIYQDQAVAYKINFSFGLVLRNIGTGELRYYYPSRNDRFLDKPVLIQDRTSHEALLAQLSEVDPLEYGRRQRPDTKWTVESVPNVAFYVNKLIDTPIGAPTDLPDYVKKNKGLYALIAGSHGPYNDNKCLFRCLALHIEQHQLDLDTSSTTSRPRRQPQLGCTRVANILLDKYLKHQGMQAKHFRGVPLAQLNDIEKLFDLNIIVYELPNAGSTLQCAQLVRNSKMRHTTTMYLNLYDKHFSYIHNRNVYASSWRCTRCDHIFQRSNNLKQHMAICTVTLQGKYPGGVFNNKPTIFQELKDDGYTIKDDDMYFPYRACFDFEAYSERLEETADGKKTMWKARHVPMSVSINSNVPGYDQPKCILSNGDPHALIKEMMEYLNSISDTSYRLLAKHHNVLLKTLDESIPPSPGPDEPKAVHKPRAQVLRNKLVAHLAELPVLGFNSGKYDFNLIKEYLYPYLAKWGDVKCIIKKNNNHMALSTSQLRFLDIRNYLAPNYSYDKWVRAYDCDVTKGKFCYEYIDSLDRLEETTLPPREAFYDNVHQQAFPEKDYAELQRVWSSNHMKTLKDLLVWYNNLDVEPFMQAAEKMVQFYQTLGVDVFKDCISIPGLTLRYLFDGIEDNFALIGQQDKDMHTCLKENIVGGPSIIFHRYHEAGVTSIRGGKLCKKVIGFDANALYLACLADEMPAGHYARWRPQDDGTFHVRRSPYRLAQQWLEWEAHNRGITIRHQGNATEKRVGDRQLAVDGYAVIDGRPTVFQFHGCYYHAHGCHLNRRKDGTFNFNDRRGLHPVDLLNEVNETTAYIESLGMDVVEQWECEFYQLKDNYPEVRAFLRKGDRPLHKFKSRTQSQLITAVKNDQLFGFVECDLHVPDHLKPTFSECPPIFKNTKVSRADIGPTMAEYAEANGILNQPRRMLIGSMFGEQILIGTPLLKWYLLHGLVITKVYQVMEFTPSRCFSTFADRVTEARRQGDQDPSKALIGETMKLLGNSGYGKTVTNQDRHVQVKICDVKGATQCLRSPLFRTLNTIDTETFEVTSAKKTIKYDLPLQIGCMVYQHAKLRMLQFYYDFMDRFFDRADWQYCEMDTDSAYMAISDPDWESLVKPHMKETYEAERDHWLPRRDQYNHDKRTPGLFKVEWEGDGIVALCSKTYYCFGGEGNKFSCKGVSRVGVDKDTYLNVIKNHQSQTGVNRGMRLHHNEMRTYVQYKDAFTYFYAKRQVQPDGVTTLPLDI